MDQDQYEFLNDRITHVDGTVDDANGRIDAVETRVLALEGAREIKKAHTLEWIVIVLIVVEIIEGVLLYKHG